MFDNFLRLKMTDINNDFVEDFVYVGIHPYKKPWKFPNTKRCPTNKCGQMFSSRKNAMFHYEKVHAKSAVFCEICDVPIAHKFYFLLHFRKFHSKHPLPEPFFSEQNRRQKVKCPIPSAKQPRHSGKVAKRKHNYDSSENSIDSDHDDNIKRDECILRKERIGRAIKQTNIQPLDNNPCGLVFAEKDVVKIVVDVNEYEEFQCNVKDESILVEAKRVYRNAHANVTQNVSYCFDISHKFDWRDVKANFSSHGILTVNVPQTVTGIVHRIQIQQTEPRPIDQISNISPSAGQDVYVGFSTMPTSSDETRFSNNPSANQ